MAGNTTGAASPRFSRVFAAFTTGCSPNGQNRASAARAGRGRQRRLGGLRRPGRPRAEGRTSAMPPPAAAPVRSEAMKVMSWAMLVEAMRWSVASLAAAQSLYQRAAGGAVPRRAAGRRVCARRHRRRRPKPVTWFRLRCEPRDRRGYGRAPDRRASPRPAGAPPLPDRDCAPAAPIPAAAVRRSIRR